MSEKASAVIVAAGTGTRLNAPIPKAFITLGGIAMFCHSLRVFDSHHRITEIILVVPPNEQQRAAALLASSKPQKNVVIVDGGKHRWQSVRSGLAACGSASPWVLVHDAARPFVTAGVIDSLLALAGTYECAVTATPVVDTIRRCKGNRALETIDRSSLVRVGTPQLFLKEKLQAAFAKAEAMLPPPTDEAVLMEAIGIAVGIAPGDPLNFKITTRADLRIAEAILAYKEE